VREISVLLQKELREALRSRWLFAFAATFAAVALLLSLVQGSSGEIGQQGFSRTTAGLINLCLLLVPLLALVLGAGSLAGERERGTLATLLAQPISPGQLILGKYLGLALAVWMAIALGFGAAGMLMALVSPVTDVQHYALFILLSGALATAMLSVGMLISVFSDGRLKALSLAILAWFAFVLLYQLGAIGLALAVSSSGRTLLMLVLANPIECTRILAIMSVESDLDVLGPLGSYVANEVGSAAGAALLAFMLAAWAVGPLAATIFVARTRDA
jgi:ABC-type transport system involved in multi-copper enzyme maturation permease subunit